MVESKVKYALVLGCSTLLGAVAQVAFKHGLNLGGLPTAEWLAVGILLYGFSTIVYFYILSRVHLSWAYGIGGLSYIFATLLAFFALSENVPPLRWAGIVVITIGVILIGIS